MLEFESDRTTQDGLWWDPFEWVSVREAGLEHRLHDCQSLSLSYLTNTLH